MTRPDWYHVTQADLDSGKDIDNTATATGDDPHGDPVTSEPSSAVVTVKQNPALTLKKTANLTHLTSAGQVVKYSFKVTNDGNVTLKSISVTDTTFTGSGQLSTIVCPTTTLAPGQSTTCSAIYTVTQADLDAPSGELTNTATATGECTVALCSPTSPPSTVHIPVDSTPLAFTGVEDGPQLLWGGVGLLLLGSLLLIVGARRRRS